MQYFNVRFERINYSPDNEWPDELGDSFQGELELQKY